MAGPVALLATGAAVGHGKAATALLQRLVIGAQGCSTHSLGVNV